MLMGARGTGLHTQLVRLYAKYKIPVFALKKTLLDHIANEKDKVAGRRRGWKKPYLTSPID